MARIAFFTANDTVHGRELWITDGTATGTRMVIDIDPDPGQGSGARALTPLGDGRVVFAATSDPSVGPQLWVSDGTEAGTRPIASVSVSGGGPYELSDPLALGDGRVTFTGYTADDGLALWITDGSAEGTAILRDFDVSSDYDETRGPTDLTAAGDGLGIFSVDDGVSGTELWGTDGTPEGTRLLVNFTAGAGSSRVLLDKAFTLPDGRVILPIDSAGWEPGEFNSSFWVTDGTQAGTQQLVAFSSTFSLYKIDPLPDGGILLTGSTGRWLTDGSAGGTAPYDPDPAPAPEPFEFTLGGGEGPYPEWAVGDAILLSDGRTLYEAQTKEVQPGGWIPPIITDYGWQLWVTDGTEAGSHVLPLTESGVLEAGVEAAPGNFYAMPDGQVLLIGARGSDDPSDSGRALFSTDGDTVTLLSDEITGLVDPTDFGGGEIVFRANKGWDRAIWRTDGTSAGTQELIPGGSAIDLLFSEDGTRYFAVEFQSTGGTGPVQLWKTDGTATDLGYVATIETTSGFESIASLGDERFVIMRDDGENGKEPWLLDGKTGAFGLLADIAPGATGSDPSTPVAGDPSPSGPDPVSTLFTERVSLEAEPSVFDLDDYFTDPSGGTLTYEVVGLPAGIVVDETTSEIKATSATPGDYSITVTASNPGGGTVASSFDWTVVDTGRLLIESTGDWDRKTKDGPILSSAGAVVTIGRKDGTGALFRIEDVTPKKGGDIKIEDGKLTVTGALFSEQIKTDRALMRGTFTVDMKTLEVTGFKDDQHAKDHRFVGDLVDPTFQGMAIKADGLAFRTDLAFGGDFAAISTADAPLKLVLGADGFTVKDGRGEVGWLPSNLELPLSGGSGMDLKFSNIGAFYDNTADALYLQGKAALEWSGAIADQFGYAFDAEEKASLTLDLFGKESSANPFLKGDKYLKIFNTAEGVSWDVVGEIAYQDTASGPVSPGNIGLRSLKIGLDTVKDLFTGELVVTIPWALKNIDVGAGLGALWAPEPALDSLSLILGGLNWPLATTGLFVQGGKLALEGIAALPKGDVSHTYTLEVDGTFGPQSVISPSPIVGKLTGKIVEGTVGGDIKLEFDGQVDLDSKVGYFTPEALDAVTGPLGSWFGIDTDEIEAFELAKLSVGAKLDFASDAYQLSGSFKALDGALSGNANMNAWWDYTDDGDGVPGDFNLDASIVGALSLPASVPLLGGKTLATGRGAWVQSFDDIATNDYLSVWSTISTLFGPVTLGVKMSMDGALSILGRGDIPKTSSWDLDESLGTVVLSAEWTNPDEGARIEIVTPDGTVISEADFAAHGGIDLIEDLNDSTSRHVALDAPASGTWDLRLVDESGLGPVRYLASEALESATASFDSVSLAADGSRIDLRMTADTGDAESATVTFFVTSADATDETAGRRIGQAILGADDTALEAALVLDDLPPGAYRLHARLEAGDTVPTIIAHDVPFDMSGAPDLGILIRQGQADPGDVPLLVIEVTNSGDRAASGARLELEVPEAMTGAPPLPGADALGLPTARLALDLPLIAPGATQTLRFALPAGALDILDPVFAEVFTGGHDADLLNNVITQTIGTAPLADGGKRLEGTEFNDRLVGGPGNDTLLGYAGADRLLGRGGDDLARGGSGGDLLRGGTGKDTLDGGIGADRLLGGAGNDRLVGKGGNDTLDGGAGNDVLLGGKGSDLAVFAGRASVTVDLALGGAQDTGRGMDRLAGIEELRSGGGDDVLSGAATDDRLDGARGDDRLFGRAGKDVLLGQGGRDLLDGGAGGDMLDGGGGADTLRGGGGADLMDGGNGDDRLNGGLGADHLAGGAGDDRLEGKGGDDTLEGGAGDDVLLGGAGHDLAVFGGRGSVTVDLALSGVQDTGRGMDRLSGIEALRSGAGDDVLSGAATDDALYGARGDDRLFGRAGIDFLFGEAGRDLLDGGAGLDLLDGGAGADTLRGGAGSDFLDGGIGRDRLEGGRGDDQLIGGAGGDVFVFGIGDGTDIVFDFTDGLDSLEIVSGATTFSDIVVTSVSGSAVLSFADVQIELSGVDAALIGAEDLSFA